MDHLVHVEQKEIIIDFELGRKCRTTLHVRSLMHTMPVAFKLQTTSPHKFCVRPPSGYICPLSELTLEIILKPQREFPSSFPFSPEKFVLKTALAHIGNENCVLPERVPNEWFSSPQTRVFIDAKLKVVYLGASLLWHCVAREDEYAVREMLGRQTWLSIAGEDGWTALHRATAIGSFKLVGVLLECGAEINAMDINGRTPLWEAVYRGYVNVVKELLKNGADVDLRKSQKGATVAPIHIAATLASTEILDQLIEHGANLEIEDREGRTAVHFAIESGRLENLKVLLHAGADKNAQRGDARTPLLIAAENGFIEAVHLLLEGGTMAHIIPENGQAASEVSSHKAHAAVMEALKAGEELLEAARQGDLKAVATLLQHRAGKRAWVKDSAGWTPLHVAAFKGHVQIVRRLLLEEGGRTALKVGDVEGHTPLHCAAEGGSIKVVELLLAMGADPRATSSRGATAADLANAFGFTTIAKLIQHHACITPCDDAYYNNDLQSRCLPSSNTEFHPLDRRCISPSPNTDHREATSASTVRFSTPTKLHENNGRQQRLSSLLHHEGRAPGDQRSCSSRNRQHDASLQRSVPKDFIMMGTPPSARVSDAKSDTDSEPLSLPSMSSSALTVPKVQTLIREAAAPLACPQHSTKDHNHSHTGSSTKLAKAAQKPGTVQSHHSQPRKKEETQSVDTCLQNRNTQNSNSNTESTCRRTPRLTLATLLARGHGSKTELSSSSSTFEATHNSPVDGGIQNLKSRPVLQKNKSKSAELAVTTSDMLPTDKQMMNNHFPRESCSMTHPQKLKLTSHLSLNQEQPEHSNRISSTTMPSFSGLYNKAKHEGLSESLHPMQLHQPTEQLHKAVDGLAFENGIPTEQPHNTHEIIKSLAFTTPSWEAQPQVACKTIQDLGVHKQRSISSALPENQQMDRIKMVEDTSKLPSSRSSVDSRPQFPYKKGEVLHRPSSMQLHASTENSREDANTVPTDKFAVPSLPTYKGITDPNLTKQHLPSASTCGKTTGTTAVEDKHVQSVMGQAQSLRIRTMSLERSQTEGTPPHMSSSLPDQMSLDFRIRSMLDIQLASTPDDPVTPCQETKRQNGIHTTPPQQAISSARKTDRMKQKEDLVSLKDTCKASLSDHNRPAYAPPLRIKQMRKPVSGPILKTSNALQDLDAETSETMLANVRQPMKPRSLIFREIFGQGTF